MVKEHIHELVCKGDLHKLTINTIIKDATERFLPTQTDAFMPNNELFKSFIDAALRSRYILSAFAPAAAVSAPSVASASVSAAAGEVTTAGAAPPAASLAVPALRGTGSPPYRDTIEYEVTGDMQGTKVMRYKSITNMPAYAHKSFEELRFEDTMKKLTGACAFLERVIII